MNGISILDLEAKKFAIFEYEYFNNAMEGFAEGFAVYVTKPSELKKKYPEQYKVMKDWVGNTKAIKDWITAINSTKLKKLPYDEATRVRDFY